MKKTMKVLLLSIFIAVIGTRSCIAISNRSFPEHFSFGTATAAYQIEGAWKEDDKGENIWDHVAHTDPTKIAHNASGDVACDSYHKYKEDISVVSNMNLSHYRFSLSWTRILPTGFNDRINVKGLLYYQNIVREIESYNITPMVTLYHWDLPQSIQDLGGWTNPKIVDYFTDFAELIFESFPSVKYWITINEPKQVCVGGYGGYGKAPFLNVSGKADYLCAYHVAKAHASVYRLYKNKFSKLGGKLSMCMDGSWNYPKNASNNSDVIAAERRRLFEFGLYAHPMYFGDWPQEVKERVAFRNPLENLTESRLPMFTKEEKKILKGTSDFLALNYYDTRIVADANEPPYTAFSYANDVRVELSSDSEWSVDVHGVHIVPDGFREYLRWLKKTYNNPEIIITENGFSDDGTLNDYQRCEYLADFLSVVLDSIYEDKVNITKYTYWSLLDNFEWAFGYDHHFGLYNVDFNSPNRTRTDKKSVEYYKQIASERKLPNPPKSRANIISINTIVITLAIALSGMKLIV